jgi:C2 domain
MNCVVCEAISDAIFGRPEDKKKKKKKKGNGEVGHDEDEDSDEEEGDTEASEGGGMFTFVKQKVFIDVLDLELFLIQADGLAAKDSIMGLIPTSSDTYVEVRFFPKGAETEQEEVQYLGKTPVKEATLEPVWHIPFDVNFPLTDLTEDAYFHLTLMDWDENNEDDLMGRVIIPIGPELTPKEQLQWYDIPPDSADGEKASGRVQCRLTVKLEKQEVFYL